MRSAAIRTVVRGAQLVADVGGEPALQVAELLELGDLAGQAFGHVVEGHRQPGHVVLAAHRHPFGQVPSANRSAIRDADRTGTTTWRETSSAIPASSTNSTAPPVIMVPRTSVMVACSFFNGKIRYSSRLATWDDAGVPMTSAGPEKPSVCTVAYW